MFDFLDSDWFNIGLEIIFLIIIIYDIKRYFETKKKEYIINIVLTAGFAYWALSPYYNSYIEWDEDQKSKMISMCQDLNDTKLCECIDNKIFKEFSFDEYVAVDKNASEYKEFIKNTKEDCLDNGWF